MSNPLSFSIRSDVQTSDAIVNGNLQVQGATNFNGSFAQNGVTYHSVTGYGPTSFSTASSTDVLNLNTSPGTAVDLATAAANATTALLLPIGAIVTRAYCDNNGTTITSAGSSTYDIGVNTTGAATADTYFDAVPFASVNTSAVVAGAGSPFSGVGVAALAALNFVTVTINTNNNTAGDLAVIIEYAIQN